VATSIIFEAMWTGEVPDAVERMTSGSRSATVPDILLEWI
jgi:hypothetical protein